MVSLGLTALKNFAILQPTIVNAYLGYHTGFGTIKASTVCNFSFG